MIDYAPGFESGMVRIFYSFYKTFLRSSDFELLTSLVMYRHAHLKKSRAAEMKTSLLIAEVRDSEDKSQDD